VTSTGDATLSVVRVSGPLDETGLTSNLTDGDVGRSWYAYVANSGPQETFISTAICSAGSDATIRTDAFTLQTGQSGNGQAFCPTGTRVVGGGVMPEAKTAAKAPAVSSVSRRNSASKGTTTRRLVSA